jgi:hypothetical protein
VVCSRIVVTVGNLGISREAGRRAGMAKKVRKSAPASDLRQKHSRRRETSIPDWGKAGAPPSPTIPSAARLKHRPARRRRIFVDKTGQPSPLLVELMAAPATAPPGSAILRVAIYPRFLRVVGSVWVVESCSSARAAGPIGCGRSTWAEGPPLVARGSLRRCENGPICADHSP